MCGQLRDCAKALETTASGAQADGKDFDGEALENVKARYEEMKAAVEAYHKYLEEAGI